ncbi:unnamed protein product [Hyaloperonospora brassicae]|nr:unnamed protein product [Hyaloperonospora brassicae]
MGMAPHYAFERLKLQQYDGELFDTALLPLLNKYVILQNKFDLRTTTTLADELFLLRGGSESRETVGNHVSEWLGAQGVKAEYEYVEQQVFWEWKLHGTPYGGAPETGWNKFSDAYDGFEKNSRGKFQEEYNQFLTAIR